jgi:uncharacterized alpha-E superfamily protein
MICKVRGLLGSDSFGGTYRLQHQGENNQRSVIELLITANVVPRSLILSALMKKAIQCSETSVLTRVMRRDIPEEGILQGKRMFRKLSEMSKSRGSIHHRGDKNQ